MHVLIVTCRLQGIGAAGYARLAEDLAPALARVPGLAAKLWLAGRASNTFGGLYLFHDRRSLDRYLVSNLVRSWSTDPRLTNLTIQTFDTLEAATRITQGELTIHHLEQVA